MSVKKSLIISTLILSIGVLNNAMAITNGEETIANNYPFTVYIKAGGATACAGALIDKSTVLTTAICVNGVNSVELILGAHDVSDPDPSQKEVHAETIIVHEGFSPITLKNDIALIKLPSPLSVTDSISPIDLGAASNANATLLGWGKTSPTGKTSDVLMKSSPAIVDDNQCDKEYGHIDFSAKNCLLNTTASGCDGDTGGPLVQNGKLVGLWEVSGIDCATNQPNISIDVAKYQSWINAKR